MDLFSCEQEQPFLMGSVFHPVPPINNPLNLHDQARELSNGASYYSKEANPGGSSSLTSSFGSRIEQNPQSSLEKRRKEMKRSSKEITGQSNGKSRRSKKNKMGSKEMEEKNPSTEYIHVRARRGQATDSHSLAERVRRERISERMKKLQELVPGCDKIIGKALVLDEIINYVQYLQNQVEFLSMKLASVNPILHEYGLDFDDFMRPREIETGNLQTLPSMIQSSHIQGPADSFIAMASSSSLLFHGEGPIAFPQDEGNLLMQMGDKNNTFEHQVEFHGLSSFQQIL